MGVTWSWWSVPRLSTHSCMSLSSGSPPPLHRQRKSPKHVQRLPKPCLTTQRHRLNPARSDLLLPGKPHQTMVKRRSQTARPKNDWRLKLTQIKRRLPVVVMLNHGWPCILYVLGKWADWSCWGSWWKELVYRKWSSWRLDLMEVQHHREFRLDSSCVGYKAEGQRKRISNNGVRQRRSILQYTAPCLCPCPTYSREDMDVPWSVVCGRDVRVGSARGGNTKRWKWAAVKQQTWPHKTGTFSKEWCLNGCSDFCHVSYVQQKSKTTCWRWAHASGWLPVTLLCVKQEQQAELDRNKPNVSVSLRLISKFKWSSWPAVKHWSVFVSEVVLFCSKAFHYI